MGRHERGDGAFWEAGNPSRDRLADCQLSKARKQGRNVFFCFCFLFIVFQQESWDEKAAIQYICHFVSKVAIVLFMRLSEDSLRPFKPTSFCIFCNVHQICIECLKISELCINMEKGTRIISELPQCIYAIVQWYPQPPVYLSSKPLTPAFSNLLHFHSSDGINDTRWRHSLKIKM